MSFFFLQQIFKNPFVFSLVFPPWLAFPLSDTLRYYCEIVFFFFPTFCTDGLGFSFLRSAMSVPTFKNFSFKTFVDLLSSLSFLFLQIYALKEFSFTVFLLGIWKGPMGNICI